MINWKELEKFIAPGKVCTLVIMVDGKEIGAFSFNIETLAYKEILEVAKPADPVKITEKPMPSNKEYVAEKKAEAAGKKITPKSQQVKSPKPEPEPMDKGGDGIEEKEHSQLVQNVYEEDQKIKESAKPMTRAEIMAQSDNEEKVSDTVKDHLAATNAEIRANEHSGSKSAENDGQPESANKPVATQAAFGEDW